MIYQWNLTVLDLLFMNDYYLQCAALQSDIPGFIQVTFF